jgi:hypothetical protein
VQRSEIRALGRLAADALAAGGTFIQDVHEGIAERAFSGAPASAPARALHDSVSRAIYAGIRGGLRAGVRAGAEVAALRTPAAAGSLRTDRRAALALGALHGVWGDALADRVPELRLDMELCRHGTPIPPDPESLRAAFPSATPRLAVFVHGLCETDEAWWLPVGGRQRTDRRSYGERLQADFAYTPLYLRYNTGLHISDNGRALARLLDVLHAAWPVPVGEIMLVGHSMGGLVARSACHYGEREHRRFTAAVRHVFCLGTPHLGADLEKGAHVLAWALRRLPETRALGTALDTRSAGIKDLRYGACVEEDWSESDPEEFLRDRCREVPFLPNAHYYFIGTELAPPLGRLVGDLLVRMPSASGRGDGRGRRIPFEVDHGHELAGLNHFALLNHPDVYARMRAWIERMPRVPLAALPAPAPAPADLLEA